MSEMGFSFCVLFMLRYCGISRRVARKAVAGNSASPFPLPFSIYIFKHFY